MPPRYVYWTILIDDAPTAFRASEREDLLPTLHQLQRKNKNVVVRWFARGRLWDSPEAERASQAAPRPAERRNQDWRPGGQHKDPRARFDKEAQRRKKREQRAARNAGPTREGHADRPREFNPRAPKAPWTPKFPGQRPRPNGPRPDRDASGGHRKPSEGRPGSAGDRRPWEKKPHGARPPGSADRKPWQNRPRGETERKPWQRKPGADVERRPWQNKPGADAARRPWENKPRADAERRPPQNKPREGERKPWQREARGSDRRDAQPWRGKPHGNPSQPWRDRPKEPKRDAAPRQEIEPKKREETPDHPPAPERIVTKPKPPERG
jgi:hypothetical protein